MAHGNMWSGYKPRLSDTGEKVRNVVCLIYLEDLEAVGKTYGDLLAYLDHKHLQAVVSPIHDKDTFTGNDVLDWCNRHYDKATGDVDTRYIDKAPYVGKPKKMHLHMGCLSKGPLDAEHWSEKFDGLLHIRPSLWEKMESYVGFVRYCAHLDSPQKAKYSAFDVVGFGGVDLSCLLKEDSAQKAYLQRDLFDLIQKRKITSFYRFFDMVMQSGSMDEISFVRGTSGMWAQYFASKGREIAAKKRRECEQSMEEMLG